MKLELGMKRYSRSKNAKLALIRKATTSATDKYGIGGRLKQRGGPKTVTLHKVKLP